MAEYIEREKVVMGVLGLTIVAPAVAQYADAVLRQIQQAPAADVAPVVHGRWEWREEWETHHETHSIDLISCGWYCTECGIELGEYLSKKTGQHIILDDDSRKPELTNCPNCGAKMDAEGGEG